MIMAVDWDIKHQTKPNQITDSLGTALCPWARHFSLCLLVVLVINPGRQETSQHDTGPYHQHSNHVLLYNFQK